jgi:hypothetical protein
MLNHGEVLEKMQKDSCCLLRDRERNTVRLYSNDPGARNGGGSEGETDIATLERLLRDGLISRREPCFSEGPGIYRYDLMKK